MEGSIVTRISFWESHNIDQNHNLPNSMQLSPDVDMIVVSLNVFMIDDQSINAETFLSVFIPHK